MNLKQSIFLLLLTLLLFTCCNTTEPPDDELKPGRRDYTWTVDTLKVAEGRSLPSRMWGANANDVWAVGMAYLNAYCIWHFDGQSWENYAPDQYIDPTGIWGTSSNNIWLGSTDGAFWYYDGAKWSKFSETVIPNFQQFVVQSMYGKSANDIYAVGFADSIDGSTYKGIIMHYNGVKWELVNIPIIKNSFKEIYYDENSGKFLISAWVFNSPTEYLYSFDGQNLNQFYSTEEHVTLVQIGRKVYVQITQKIYEYKNETLELIKDFSSTNYIGNAFGRTEKDFFTINWDGIGHYNGSDLVTIFEKWNIEWAPGGGTVFEKDAFFIWNDSFNTFIVHGKLHN